MLDENDDAIYKRVKRIAQARGSKFLPVHMTCDSEEALRRVTDTSRINRMKLSDPKQLREYQDSKVDYVPNDEYLLRIDTTHQLPKTSASQIIEAANSLK